MTTRAVAGVRNQGPRIGVSRRAVMTTSARSAVTCSSGIIESAVRAAACTVLRSDGLRGTVGAAAVVATWRHFDYLLW